MLLSVIYESRDKPPVTIRLKLLDLLELGTEDILGVAWGSPHYTPKCSSLLASISQMIGLMVLKLGAWSLELSIHRYAKKQLLPRLS